MRNLRTFSLVLCFILLTAVLSPTFALSSGTITGVTAGGAIDCVAMNEFDITVILQGNNDDTGTNDDVYSIVIYDANGVLVAGAVDAVPATGGPFNLTSRTLNVYNNPTARPFFAVLVDTGNIPGTPTAGEATTGNELDEFLFDPASFSDNCESLPNYDEDNLPNVDTSLIAPDSRDNYGKGDILASTYIDSTSGISIYGINSSSEGFLALNLEPAILPDSFPGCSTAPSENLTLDSVTINGVIYAAYYLTTCELQVNVGPDAEGKVFVMTWYGVPPDPSSFKFTEFNVNG